VSGPHDLVNTSFFDDNCLEQLTAGIISLKRAMICWMPVSCSEHKVKLWIGTQFLDQRKDHFVVLNAQTSPSTEVILNIDNDKSSSHFKVIILMVENSISSAGYKPSVNDF